MRVQVYVCYVCKKDFTAELRSCQYYCADIADIADMAGKHWRITVKDPKPMKFSMRMTEKLYEDLRAYAEADRRKMVDLVTLILEDYAACRGPVEHLPAETRPEPKSLVKVFRLSTMLPPGNPEENKKTEREKGQMEMDELKK